MTDFTKESLEERLKLMETQVIPFFLHIPMHLREYIQTIQKGETMDGLGAVNERFFVQKQRWDGLYQIFKELDVAKLDNYSGLYQRKILEPTMERMDTQFRFMEERLREGNVGGNPALNEEYFREFEQLFEGYTATVRSFTEQKGELKRFIGIFSQFDAGTIKLYLDQWITDRIDGLRKYAQNVNAQI